MIEQHPYRAKISPVSEGINRPLWSVMIPTYNCANYLRETLASVLAQDPGEDVMQIEVVDDCSTKDDPQGVVEELGRGRVQFYRQPENVGFIKNFNTCLTRSHGKIIHILHGDDRVLNGFYQKMELLFTQYPEIGAAISRHLYIDMQGHWQGISGLELPESGVLSNWLELIASGQRITTPSIVVQRDVYEKLGGFDRRFSCTGEDWEMWVRIAAHYSVGYEVQPLAEYRIANFGSLTQNSVRTGKFYRDLGLANEIIQSYLPHHISDKLAKNLSRQALEATALLAIDNAYRILNTGDVKTLIVQVKEALKLSYSFRVIAKSINIILKLVIYKLKQKVVTIKMQH
jgi:glycosyltransferase involved in cell wall biosynthesis